MKKISRAHQHPKSAYITLIPWEPSNQIFCVKMGSKNHSEIPTLSSTRSKLGDSWIPLFEEQIRFQREHFITAMKNLIRHPNINSTVILRADIISERLYDLSNNKANEAASDEDDVIPNKPDIPRGCDGEIVLEKNLDDVSLKSVPLDGQWAPTVEIVRRIIPRNPFKDCIINQTCLMLSLEDSVLVVYRPHIDSVEDCPFYLPSVQAVGILLTGDKLSVHYLPFNYLDEQVLKQFKSIDPNDRNVRIALRLLQTSKKHSTGVMDGYQKRVNHDLVVSKTSFQDRYISLKKKYTKYFVDNWVESTDPRKHVFEDIAIAAFLIELWSKIYKDKNDFEFRDLGCGNGLLVNILLSEGYRGFGIDARSRKSWKIYSDEVQSKLKEQVIIPSVLLKPHPQVKSMAPHISDNGRVFQIPVNSNINDEIPVVAYYSSAALLRSKSVNTAQFPKNTFIIGNHSDELTCWIPLLGYPFLVIPCCSHALNGSRIRYNPMSSGRASTYASLVDHVELLAKQCGWEVQREMLRIPSTRNAAIIGYKRDVKASKDIYELLAMEGGAEGWVENTMALAKRPPRKH